MEETNEQLKRDILGIGNNIKVFLDAKGESISQFSRTADISYTTAFDLYHGKTTQIKFEMLDKLCAYFGVGPSELFPYMPDNKKK